MARKKLTSDEALVEVYKKLRPGDPATPAGGRSILEARFFDEKKYDIGKVGRYKFNKKLNVIRDITKDMDLGELEILHSRAEDLASKQEYREAYDIATTRAVSNFSTILEYMLPFIKVEDKRTGGSRL